MAKMSKSLKEIIKAQMSKYLGYADEGDFSALSGGTVNLNEMAQSATLKGISPGHYWLDEAFWDTHHNTKFTDEVKAAMNAKIDDAVKEMLASKGAIGLLNTKGEPIEKPSPGYSEEAFTTFVGKSSTTYQQYKKEHFAQLYSGGVIGAGSMAGLHDSVAANHHTYQYQFEVGGSSYAAAENKLKAAVPGLDTYVECPACLPREVLDMNGAGEVIRVRNLPRLRLIKMVIHLNDDHGWPRVDKDRVARGLPEGTPNIADWLDKVCADQGIDQTFHAEPEPAAPSSPTAGFKHAVKAMVEYHDGEFYTYSGGVQLTPGTVSDDSWLSACEWPTVPSSVEVLSSGAFKFHYEEE